MEEKTKKKKVNSRKIMPFSIKKSVEEVKNQVLEKLLKENIAFCIDEDIVTIEGRGHKFEYSISRDNWHMLGSAKAASGIDSLINLLLRR